mgnify:CR=1 FL=1
MKFLKKILLLVLFLFPTSFIFAVGNIDATNNKAKIESDGSLINFGYFTTNSDKNITVKNSELTGYMWSENIGWVSLNCSNNSSCGSSNFKVSNTTGGVLSGYAWGENSGWVNFGPFNNSSAQTVTIDSSGNFDGYAWSQNFGWIQFDCGVVNACVNTSWRPSVSGGGGGGGGGPSENILPNITILSPDSLVNFYTSLQEVILSASAVDPDGEISKLFIYINNNLIASVNNSNNISIPWTPNLFGVFNLQYKAVDNDGGEVYSNVVVLNFEDNFCVLNPNDPICYSDDGSGGDGDPGDDGSGGGGTGEEGGGEDDPSDVDDPIDGGGGGVGGSGGDDGDNPQEGGGGFGPLGGCQYETNIFNVALCIIVDTYNYTIDTFLAAFSEIRLIINNDFGNPIIKIIGIVGILFGAIFSVLPVLFGTPLSFTEIWMLPYRLWSALMSAFGIKKRARPWGTVYDSITKQPLDPVMVSLQDLEGQEIQSSITDMDGRYGFLVEPGKYRLLPKKTHYSFPSLKLVGKTRDEIYLDLYFGDVFEVNRAGDVIIKNIPMDPIGFDWNEFAKRDQKLMKYYSKRDVFLTKLSDSFFSFGFTVACLAIVSSFSTYNILVFCLYLILLFLRETGIKTKNFGKVIDVEGNPISFAIIKVYNSDTNTLISKKVANKYGQYYCLMPQGNYFVEIDQKLADESYKTVFKSAVINANKGYINNVFKINL